MNDQPSNHDNLISFVATRVETISDRVGTMQEQMATKDGLAKIESTMRGEFEQVHIRFDSVDRTLSARMGTIETELSRLRSVAYLLVKDKPDMLRLLGQPTPGGEG